MFRKEVQVGTHQEHNFNILSTRFFESLSDPVLTHLVTFHLPHSSLSVSFSPCNLFAHVCSCFPLGLMLLDQFMPPRRPSTDPANAAGRGPD